MIIHLKKSTLFTVDPDLRFARENSVPFGLWSDMYRRYSQLMYTIDEVREFYEFKTGQKKTNWYLARWIWRSDIYWRVNPIMKQGAEMVVSSYFGEDEMRVIKEITKNLRASVNKTTKALP